MYGLHHYGQKALPWRHRLKWLIEADLDQQLLLSQSAGRGPENDCGNLPAMVEAASQRTRIGLVLADAEFDSERNHTYIRQRLRARSVIPAKGGRKPGACVECGPKCGGPFRGRSIGVTP